MLTLTALSKGRVGKLVAKGLGIVNVDGELWMVTPNGEWRQFWFADDEDSGGSDASQEPQWIMDAGDATLDANHSFYAVDCSAGAINLIFPDPADRIGKGPLVVKRMDATPNGNALTAIGTFDGQENFTLINNGGAFTSRAITGGYLITTAYLYE